MAESRIDQIDAQIARLQARRKLALARSREAERKRDTRRKVILGGALLALARAGDSAAASTLGKLLAGLPERDRKPFEGWTPD